MPQLQNVILTDRTPVTAVNHTFTPRDKESGGNFRLAKAGVSAIADMILAVEPRVTPGGRRKVTLRLSVPIVQTKTENGVISYVVTRASRAMIEFDSAPDSTEQERKDLVGMLMSSLDPSKVLINDILVKNEGAW